MNNISSRIVLYLSPEANGETRYLFFLAVELLSEMLKKGVDVDGAADVKGVMEKWDVLGNIASISVFEEQHVSTCKQVAKLILEKHQVGDKYELVVIPTL